MGYHRTERNGAGPLSGDRAGRSRTENRAFIFTHFDDWFVRKTFPPIFHYFCDWNIHPSVLTGLALGFSAAIPFFHWGHMTWAVIAAILLRQLLDCLDGEVARRCRKTSSLGAWLDNIADGVFYLALILVAVSFFIRPLFLVIILSGLVFAGLFAVHVWACPRRAIMDHALKDYDTPSLYRKFYAFLVNNSLVFAAAVAVLYGLMTK